MIVPLAPLCATSRSCTKDPSLILSIIAFLESYPYAAPRQHDECAFPHRILMTLDQFAHGRNFLDDPHLDETGRRTGRHAHTRTSSPKSLSSVTSTRSSSRASASTASSAAPESLPDENDFVAKIGKGNPPDFATTRRHRGEISRDFLNGEPFMHALPRQRTMGKQQVRPDVFQSRLRAPIDNGFRAISRHQHPQDMLHRQQFPLRGRHSRKARRGSIVAKGPAAATHLAPFGLAPTLP